MTQLLVVLIVFAVATAFLVKKLISGFSQKQHDCDGCAVAQISKKNH